MNPLLLFKSANALCCAVRDFCKSSGHPVARIHEYLRDLKMCNFVFIRWVDVPVFFRYWVDLAW